MKVLIARLNAQLFQVYSRIDQPLSAGMQGEDDDEDLFSHAFHEQVTLGTSLTNTPIQSPCHL